MNNKKSKQTQGKLYLQELYGNSRATQTTELNGKENKTKLSWLNWTNNNRPNELTKLDNNDYATRRRNRITEKNTHMEKANKNNTAKRDNKSNN